MATHRELVLEALEVLGPCSDYRLYHYVHSHPDAIGKPSPSSVRTRRAELCRSGKIVADLGRERTPSRRWAQLWRLK